MADRTNLIATLRNALPALRAHYPIRTLSLFGSRIRNDATPASDLDILVDLAEPIPLSKFLALEARLAELTGLNVDLVSAAALKPHIGARIRAEALPL